MKIGQETRRMKAIIGRSVVIVFVLLFGLIVFSATPSIAETLLLQLKQQKEDAGQTQGKAATAADSARLKGTVLDDTSVSGPTTSYVATAYSLRGRTASGRMVSRGLIAADPRVLPLGSRVRLEHPGYSGEYLVADTGGAIRGRHIDIWTPSSSEAMRFGRRTVKLTVLSYGGRRGKKQGKG
jgi:3D (Asp-Asp-Asp) domain-containing protein